MRASLASAGIALALALPSGMAAQQTAAPSFPDVSASHENVKAIVTLFRAGLIAGYPDGRFGPERSINRAELLKILIGSIGTDAGELKPADCYPDVRASDWFSPYVCAAASRGWVNGYDDGLFKPERNVSLAEALKMFVNVRQSPLADASYPALGYARGEWFTPYVDTMLYKDAVSLESVTLGGKNGLDKPLMRMLAAEMLYRAMLDDGRVSFGFRTDGCDMEGVKRVSLQKYDLTDQADGTVIVDFDVFGTLANGKQCLIASHANPYAGASRWWHSRTMFLVAPMDHDKVLEEVSVAGGKVYLRSGHDTAGLGDDLWQLSLKTGLLTQIPSDQ